MTLIFQQIANILDLLYSRQTTRRLVFCCIGQNSQTEQLFSSRSRLLRDSYHPRWKDRYFTSVLGVQSEIQYDPSDKANKPTQELNTIVSVVSFMSECSLLSEQILLVLLVILLVFTSFTKLNSFTCLSVLSCEKEKGEKEETEWILLY